MKPLHLRFRVAILAIGASVLPSLAAAEILKEKGIDAQVVNMRFVKPLDAELLAGIAAGCRHIFTVEENTIIGGFGSAILEAMGDAASQQVSKSASQQVKGLSDLTTFRLDDFSGVARIVRLGMPDRFVPHASRSQLLQAAGLDARSIAERIEREIASPKE